MVTVGEDVIAAPFPSVVPPHKPEYHIQPAPLPKLPPETLMVVDEPLQIVPDEAVAKVAGTELSLTVISLLTQLVVLQTFSALT